MEQLLLPAGSPSVEIQPTDQAKPYNRLRNLGMDYGKEYRWQKGQSGNPAGRPKGKTFKEWVREFLYNMSDEARIEYLQSLDPELVWKMAEGNPHQSQEVRMEGNVTHQVIGMQVNREVKTPDAKLISPTE